MTDAKCQLERDLLAAKQIPVDCIVVFDHQTWSSCIEMESITGVPAEDNTYIIDAACAAPRLAAEVERLRGRVAELEARCFRSAEFYGGQLENETHWTISHMPSGRWHVRVNTLPVENYTKLESAWEKLYKLGLWPAGEVRP